MNHYVKQIDERLVLGSQEGKFELGRGYLVKINEKIIGYVYLSPISNYRMYIEYSILKKERKNGYGKLLLDEITWYIFSNYNIKSIELDIDKSNLASMKTALSCGYMYDESDFINNSRIEFSQLNPNFINKRK